MHLEKEITTTLQKDFGSIMKRKSQTLAQENVPAYNIMLLIQLNNAPRKRNYHNTSKGL